MVKIKDSNLFLIKNDIDSAITFYQESRKIINLTLILGILISFIFILSEKNEFTLNTIIQVPKVDVGKNKINLHKQIEDYNVIALRLNSFGTYSDGKFKACNINSESDLINKIKISTVIIDKPIIKISIRDKSKEDAVECANNIINIIQKLYDENINDLIILVDDDIKRYKAIINNIKKTEPNKSPFNYYDIYNVGEFNNIIDKIDYSNSLRSYLTLARVQVVVPYSISIDNKLNKKIIIIILGIVLSSCLGVAISIIKKINKINVNSVK